MQESVKIVGRVEVCTRSIPRSRPLPTQPDEDEARGGLIVRGSGSCCSAKWSCSDGACTSGGWDEASDSWGIAAAARSLSTDNSGV